MFSGLDFRMILEEILGLVLAALCVLVFFGFLILLIYNRFLFQKWLNRKIMGMLVDESLRRSDKMHDD